MKSTYLGILTLFAVVFILGGCSGLSVRSTSQLFHTGRALEVSENRLGARAMVYPPFPSSVFYELGLPAGFGVSAGYGIHGIQLNGTDADDTDDTNHGPELYVTEELYSAGDVFYVGTLAGADFNIVPRFDAFVQAGVSASIYPLDWLYVSGSVRGGYLVGGTAGGLQRRQPRRLLFSQHQPAGGNVAFPEGVEELFQRNDGQVKVVVRPGFHGSTVAEVWREGKRGTSGIDPKVG